MLACFTSSAPLFARLYKPEEIRAIYDQRIDRPDSSSIVMKRDSREWRELNMPALAQKVCRTKSATAFLECEYMLQPVHSVVELLQRQGVVRYLANNDALFTQLDALSSALSLELESTLTHFLDANARVVIAPLGRRLPSWSQLVVQMSSVLISAQNLPFILNQIVRSFGSAFDSSRGLVGRSWVGVNASVQSLMTLGIVINMVDLTLFTAKQIREAHARVHDVGRVLALAKRAHTLLNDHPTLLFSPIGHAFKAAEPSDGLSSLADRFTKDDMGSWLTTTFSSLDAYDTLRQEPFELAAALRALAVLDAHLSVVRLYNSFSEKNLPLSYAIFGARDPFSFEFSRLINVLVPHSVPNDLSLSAGALHHAVFTGPHGCGKTTAMKSAAHAFVLGQSLTLVPAAFAHFTPITAIHTYFNIGDSLEEGLSSFQAEHQRMEELTSFAMALPPNARALLLVDEPYAKTIQLIGEPRVTAFVKQLAPATNLSLLLATHFEGPSLLGEQFGIQNFQPLLNDDLSPSYRIDKGSATWWFHDSDRRERFLDKLLGASR